MKLQQLQLKDLADWLSKAEEEISTTEPIASDLDMVKLQVSAIVIVIVRVISL